MREREYQRNEKRKKNTKRERREIGIKKDWEREEKIIINFSYETLK